MASATPTLKRRSSQCKRPHCRSIVCDTRTSPLNPRVFHVHCTGTSFSGEINWQNIEFTRLMAVSNNGGVVGPFRGDWRAASRLSNPCNRYVRLDRVGRDADALDRLLDKTGVVVSPGNVIGAAGEGFFRVALMVPDDRLREAAARIRRALVDGEAA